MYGDVKMADVKKIVLAIVAIVIVCLAAWYFLVVYKVEEEKNLPPIPYIWCDRWIADVNVEITLYGNESKDLDGKIVKYNWTFDDGTPPKYDKIVRHKYTNGGRHVVKLTVTDDKGAVNTTQRTIKVKDLYFRSFNHTEPYPEGFDWYVDLCFEIKNKGSLRKEKDTISVRIDIRNRTNYLVDTISERLTGIEIPPGGTSAPYEIKKVRVADPDNKRFAPTTIFVTVIYDGVEMDTVNTGPIPPD
jgi:hypothetical protein